jgi:hypothetical protein
MNLMKKIIACALPIVASLLVSSLALRAGTDTTPAPAPAPPDQFSQLETSPYVYWVPAPTPRVVYYYPPPGYYAGPPPPYYYGGAYYYGPPRPVIYGPRFFFGFRFH